MNVFVIAETEKGARELCAAARNLGGKVTLAALGSCALGGVADSVFQVVLPEGSPMEAAADTVVQLVKDTDSQAVLVEPTRRLKIVGGKVAAAFGTAAVTDLVSLKEDVASNLYFGGLAVMRQIPKGSVRVFITGPAAFGEGEVSGTDDVQQVVVDAPVQGVRVISREELPPRSVDLAACKNIVAAGRGFNEEGKLEWGRRIAKLIGGEMGCTRPLTEAENWLPREAYIGVSGLMLSPDVYVGLGVSGQMQHMVGVNGAKTVFAVNRDANAPIFSQADYGLVADIDEALPFIIEKLQ